MTSPPAILYQMDRYRTIDSPSNNRVKTLVQIREGKGDNDLLLIEGMNILKTAVDSGAEVRELLVTERTLAKNRGFFNSSIFNDVDISIISERVAGKLSDTVTPQGVFAVAIYGHGTLDKLPSRGVIPVLDRIQDPGNLGTIIRTGDAFGISSMVLLSGTCDPSNPKVIRSSAGSVFHMNLVKCSEGELIGWAKGNEVAILSSDAGAVRPLKDIAPGKRSLVVLGNESSGVRGPLIEASDSTFMIPMPGRAESLNVATASAIIFYELSKKIKNA